MYWNVDDMNCWLDIDLARWVPRKWLEDYSHLHLGGFGRCAKNSSRDLWIFRPFLWRIIRASWLLLMLLRQKSSSWPKLCTLFYTPIKGTWLFPAIACLDLKLGKDPPYHLWCSFYGICASEKGARSRIPSNGEWRRQLPLVHQRRKVEARTQEGTTRDWSRVYGPSSKGILCLSWKFSPTPPRNSLDLKELARVLLILPKDGKNLGVKTDLYFRSVIPDVFAEIFTKMVWQKFCQKEHTNQRSFSEQSKFGCKLLLVKWSLPKAAQMLQMCNWRE